MANPLNTPQRLDIKWDESALLVLSRAQNDGMANLPAAIEGGKQVGYDSWYAIAVDADGTPTGYVAAQQTALQNVKNDLYAQIDADAEQQRLKYITPGAGQAMEYQEAQAESARALAALAADPNAELTPADYPMLASSIGYDTDPTTGKPTTDVAGEARAVDTARKQFLQVGAAIRDVRLTGKSAVDATNTIQTARDAYAAIKWPTFG